MSDELIVGVEGKVGRIRLNRPKAIHALTTGMCEGILDALAMWETDPAVEAIVIDHAAGRGFCAGGDVRMVAESGRGDGVAARAFFRTEYRMNHALFTCAKPTIAFMDGITMGGGVGVALPCRYRVATENTKFAMPETAIGLFPDVGGGWYLARLPGRMGQFLALTGHRLNGAEAHALRLATHYIPSDRLDEAKRVIGANPQEIDANLLDLATPHTRAHIMDRRPDIDRLFAADEVENVLAALKTDGGDWAAEQLTILRTRSPLAMKVSLRLLYDGKLMPFFADEMRQEFAVASRMAQRHDFLEGVRAVLVDKDNAPRWDPARVEDVSDHVIDTIFAPLSEAEQWEP